MKKSGLVHTASWTLAILCITIQLFNSTNSANDGALLDFNLNVTIQSNGDIIINWDQPKIQSDNGTKDYPVQEYHLNFVYNDAGNHTVEKSIPTGTERQALIHNAFLGSTYFLALYCQVSNTVVLCKNHTFIAYPSCPKEWFPHLTQCYYISNEEKTWSASKNQCQILVNNSKNTTASVQSQTNLRPPQNQSRLWMADEKCSKVTPEAVSRYNCCMSLTPAFGDDYQPSAYNPFANTSAEETTCTENEKLPSFCRKEVQVITSMPENITFSTYPDNSVRVSWSESQQGWNLLWRTIAVLDQKYNKLNAIVTPNAQMSARLPILTPGSMYNVLIWPHKDGASLLENAVKATFTIIAPRSSAETNGGAMQIRPGMMDAVLMWNGTIQVKWAAAQAKKEDTGTFYADKYQLIYGPISSNVSEYVRVNLTQTSYSINYIQKTSPYAFYLRCIFASIVINCGRIPKLDITLPFKIVKSQGTYILYELSSNTTNKSWPDAEQYCQKKKGHLISIVNITSQENITTSISVQGNRWIGANSCNANGTLTWSDGTPWVEANSHFNDSAKSNATHCCIQSIYKNGWTSWNYNNCSLPQPFLCKYITKDIGVLNNLTVTTIASTIVELNWQSQTRLWSVSNCTVYICPEQNASNVNGTSNQTACSLYATVNSPPVTVSGLARMTTYTFQVQCSLDAPPLAVNASVRTTTGAILAVVANVSSDGNITLEWPMENNVQNGSTVYVIQPVSTNGASMNITTVAAVNTNKTCIQGLQLGSSYNYTLSCIDNKTGNLLDTVPFTINSSPNCKVGEYRYNLSCYWIAAQQVTWDDGSDECQNQGGTLALVSTTDEALFLLALADRMGTPFWIQGKTSGVTKNDALIKLTGTDPDAGRKKRDITKCRVITPDRAVTTQNGVYVEVCGQTYPAMCERRITVKVGALSNVTVANTTASSVTITWKPTSWKPSTLIISTVAVGQTVNQVNSTTTTTQTVNQVNSTNNVSRTKRAAQDSDNSTTIGDNMAVINNLQPNTKYIANITPVVSLPSMSPIKGNTTTVEFSTTTEVNEMPRSEAQSMNLESMESENATQTSSTEQTDTFRLISCITFIVLVTISLFIFCICGIFHYRDCLCQICFQLSLLIAHILLLLDGTIRSQLNCTGVAISIHYFFMVCFLFFALECFCHLKVMTSMIPMKVLSRSWQLFLIGWGLPLLVIIISAATVRDQYVLKDPKHHCWLNLDGDAMYATVIPITIFVMASLVFLSLSICARPDENYEVDEESYIRYEPMQDIRWMLLFILCLLVSHWALGMVAVHTSDSSLYIAFIVLTIILGIAILMLRCIGDDMIRLRIRTCSQGSSIGPGETDIGKYLTSHEYGGKGSSPGADGCLIIKKTYIFRP